MAFSSFNFVLMLPILVLAFWCLPPRYQKPWLLVISGLVYFAAGWRDLALLVVMVSANWAGPYVLGVAPRVTATLVVGDLAALAWFKYRIFLADIVQWDHPSCVKNFL